jgi:hypothetical protein
LEIYRSCNALESDLEPVSAIADSQDVANPFGITTGAEIVLSHGFLQQVSNAGGLDIVDLTVPRRRDACLGQRQFGASWPPGAISLGRASLALMRGGVAVRAQGQQRLNLQFTNPALVAMQ